MAELKQMEKLQDLIRPLTSEELDDLRRSIEMFGLKNPILVWEEKNEIIDGWHRYQIMEERGEHCPIATANIENEADAIKLGLALNLARRQLSVEDKKQLEKKNPEIVKALRDIGFTQKETGKTIGLSQPRVSQIEKEGQIESKNEQEKKEMSTNTNTPEIAVATEDNSEKTDSTNNSGQKPADLRTKLSPEQKAEIREALKRGEDQQELADEYNVSKQTISKIKVTQKLQSPDEKLKTKVEMFINKQLKIGTIHGEKEKIIDAVINALSEFKAA
ncbi:MAG: ParB N-terminal domain-containing protein [bacterium]